jgi:hypothetical protein
MSYINETVTLPDGSAVQRFNVAGASSDGEEFVVYQAWERDRGHSTTTLIGAAWFGRVGTAPLPTGLEALPAYSDERVLAVSAWHQAEYARAYRLIERTYSPLAWGRRRAGQIERVESVPEAGRTEHPPQAECREALHVLIDSAGEPADSTDARCDWCGGWVQSTRLCPSAPVTGVLLGRPGTMARGR